MDTKTSVIKNVHGIIEDHQRRLFLDLASYVDQQLSKHLTERGIRSEKRTRFDSDDVVVRDEVWFRVSSLGMFFDFLPGKPIVLHSLKLTAKSTLKIMGFDLKTESPKTSREAPIFRCNPAVSFREGSGQVTWHSSIMEALPPSRPSSNEVTPNATTRRSVSYNLVSWGV